MSQILIFCKKEWLEALRSHKLTLLLIFFIVFGMLSPVIAKMTPQLMEFILPDLGEDLGSELTKNLLQNLPEPTIFDAWLQFFKNMSQMGLILIVIVFSGILVDEYQKDTLPMLLTKGLRGNTLVLGKFIANGLLIIGAYLLGFSFCALYGFIYFGRALTLPILLGTILLLVAYLWLIALFILFGSLFNKLSGVLLASLCFLGLLYLINLHHVVPFYNPISLFGLGAPLTLETINLKDYLGSILSTFFSLLGFLGAATWFSNRREV